MFPLSCVFVDVSMSYSSTRLPLVTTIRISSGWVPSINMRVDMKYSSPQRNRRARANGGQGWPSSCAKPAARWFAYRNTSPARIARRRARGLAGASGPDLGFLHFPTRYGAQRYGRPRYHAVSGRRAPRFRMMAAGMSCGSSQSQDKPGTRIRQLVINYSRAQSTPDGVSPHRGLKSFAK